MEPVRLGRPLDDVADPLAAWPFADHRAADNAEDAQKVPCSIDAVYRVKRVDDPQWSPDGTRLLFTVTAFDLPKAKSNADIYVVDADGSNLHQLTRNEGYDGNARWSPDGTSFLFVSGREAGSQLWIMPIDGGEPRQITKLSTGVDEPRWSPDGKRIAFSSRVFPEHGADDAANKRTREAMDKSPSRAHIADHLLYRHWSFYKDGTRNHLLVVDVDTEKVVDLTPGDFESPAFEVGGGTGFAWSPDGKELCFVSNREAVDKRAWSTNKDLFVVPSEGGEVVNITQTNPAYDGHPVYAPNGNAIAYLRQERPGFEADTFRLAIHDRMRGTSTIVTDKLDAWLTDFRWSADSKSITFQAPVKGRFPLFRIDVSTSKAERVRAIPSTHAYDVSKDGKIAFTYSAVGDPVELFVMDGAGQPKRVTELNREIVAKHDVRPVEELWLPGAEGKPVHTFVVKPHGFDPKKKYPLIVNVHGGPQFQWADSFRGDWQVYPSAGYVVAFPNPHGSLGYGQAYTDAISKDWGGLVYQDVMAVTDALAKLDYVDADRMGAMGWSYGGYFMNWLGGHSNRFKAIASMMGIFDLRSFYGGTEELWFPEWDIGGTPWENPDAYRALSPSTYIGQYHTPTLIVTGEKDYRIPYTESLAFFTALRRRNVPARLVVFPNDGHWPRWVESMPVYYAAHLDWFHRYLGGDPSPYDPVALARGTVFSE